MTFKNSPFINIVLLLLLTLLTFSCKTEFITIKKENLGVSNVTLYEEGNKIYTANFLRFDFQSSLPATDIDENSLFHVKASFIKNNEVIAKTFASGIFLTEKLDLDKNIKTGSYSAYLSKYLKVKLLGSKKTISIIDLDYDMLEFVVLDPVMIMADKYRSNVIQYTKSSISKIIKNDFVKEATLKY